MTTIAYKDGIIAGDTQLSADNVIYRVCKIYQTPDGGLVGGCGEWNKAYAAIDWLLNGKVGEPPEFKEAQLLLIDHKGALWFADESFPAYPILDKHAAIGCGAQAAMLAMNAGATAIEAVRQVISVDSGTSAPVLFLGLEKKRKK